MTFLDFSFDLKFLSPTLAGAAAPALARLVLLLLCFQQFGLAAMMELDPAPTS